MPTAGMYLLGQDMQAISVQLYTVAANGTLSASTSVDLMAYFRRVAGSLTQETQDIRPTWQTGRNMVPLNHGDAFEVGALQRSDDEDALHALIRTGLGSGYRYLISYEAGQQIVSSWATFEGLDYGVSEEGENLMIARFGPFTPTDAVQTSVS